MSLLTRARRLLARTLPLDTAAGWSIVRGSDVTDYQRTGREARYRGWERHPIVNACVRAVVDIVAAVEFEVYRRQADGTAQVIADHDAAALLNLQPRVGLTGHGLRAALGMQYQLFGNCLWVLERHGRRGLPTGIRVVHPERLQAVLVNRDEELVRYDWTDTMGAQHESPVEDVLHFRDLTASQDGLFGYPRFAAALQDIVADAEATQYVRQVVTNHGVPGLAVKTKGHKSQADLRAAEEAFNEKMLRRGGRGGAYFINADEVEFSQIGFNLADLEFPDLRRVSRESICAAAGVDPRIIGIASATKDAGLSGTQYREARFRLIQQTVMPLLKSVEAELNRWYMPEWGEVLIRFSPDALSELTEDETTTSERARAELAAGMRSVEESRELVGLSAAFDSSHHLALPGTISLTAVSIALAEAAEPTPEPASARPSAADAPADEPPAPRALPAPRTRFLRRGMVLTEAQKAALWQAIDTRATREEPAFERQARMQFQIEADDWARFFAQFTALDDTAFQQTLNELIRQYGPNGVAVQAWRERYESMIRDLVMQAFGEHSTAVGISLPLENPRAQSAIQGRVTKLSGHVTETTANQIRGILTLGRQEGMSTPDIAELINQAVFGGQVAARSRTIARTETIGALNEGAYVGAVSGGVMQSKQWLSQRDDRVRPSHVEAEAAGWIPLGSAFPNGLLYPGDANGEAEEVINCRCTLLFSDEEVPS